MRRPSAHRIAPTDPAETPARVVTDRLGLTALRLVLSSLKATLRGRPAALKAEVECERPRGQDEIGAGQKLRFQVIRVVPKDGIPFIISKDTRTVIKLKLNALNTNSGTGAFTTASTLQGVADTWTIDPVDQKTGEAFLQDGSVPPRRELWSSRSFATLEPTQLYDIISKESAGLAIVALKPQNVARGYFKGHVFLVDKELEVARSSVLGLPGVHLYTGDQHSTTVPTM